jgi:RNA recognition motif-containing protein
VRNISFDATEDDLYSLFEQAGAIKGIKFLRGKAYVKFVEEEGQ